MNIIQIKKSEKREPRVEKAQYEGHKQMLEGYGKDHERNPINHSEVPNLFGTIKRLESRHQCAPEPLASRPPTNVIQIEISKWRKPRARKAQSKRHEQTRKGDENGHECNTINHSQAPNSFCKIKQVDSRHQCAVEPLASRKPTTVIQIEGLKSTEPRIAKAQFHGRKQVLEGHGMDHERNPISHSESPNSSGMMNRFEARHERAQETLSSRPPKTVIQCEVSMSEDPPAAKARYERHGQMLEGGVKAREHNLINHSKNRNSLRKTERFESRHRWAAESLASRRTRNGIGIQFERSTRKEPCIAKAKDDGYTPVFEGGVADHEPINHNPNSSSKMKRSESLHQSVADLLRPRPPIREIKFKRSKRREARNSNAKEEVHQQIVVVEEEAETPLRVLASELIGLLQKHEALTMLRCRSETYA